MSLALLHSVPTWAVLLPAVLGSLLLLLVIGKLARRGVKGILAVSLVAMIFAGAAFFLTSPRHRDAPAA